jgi:maleylacetoacetate isomerase
MILYSYARSSAAYRVRIALAMKGLSYDTAAIHLGQAAHREPDYLAVNPQGMVPALADGEVLLAQSLAIIEYLDECHPEPPLLPADPAGRAQVRRLAMMIAADIHPLQNSRVLSRLRTTAGFDDDQVTGWVRHWIEEGFRALECIVGETGAFCYGDHPGLADIVLVPQMTNARRFGVDLSPYPTLQAIDSRCRALPAFATAAPENQADY